MEHASRLVGLVIGALNLAACGGGGGDGGAGVSVPGGRTGSNQSPQSTPGRSSAAASFVDATAASGIAFHVGYRNFVPRGLAEQILERAATGGVAAGDYDQDGDVDLFITRGDIGPNLLYRNNGLGIFTDVADTAGLAFTATPTANYRHSGPTFADMDGDRDLDLFIGGLFGDPSFIFANNGDGTFKDATPGSGIDTMQSTNNVGAAFGDYDLDGDLDMFVTHWGTGRDPLEPGDTEHLWRNDSDNGDIVFTSVSEQAGIAPSILTLPDPYASQPVGDATFTPTFARIGNVLHPDLLIVADFNQTQFFNNDLSGTYSNATDTGVLTDDNGMGSAVGDFDNDGDLDWFVSAIYGNGDNGNRFYRNDAGRFVDRTAEVGVGDGGWGWGACAIDFDNDGTLDIYQTNGWDLEGDYKTDVTRAFWGLGNGSFADQAKSFGLNDTQQGRGVVCADFDNDGDVDILQMHRGMPISATMWRNDSVGNNFLRIQLNGTAPNTQAAGARIYVTVVEKTQMREIMIGNNFVSQNPTIQIFGIGKSTQIDEVKVQWPDGLETLQIAVAAGQTLVINHPKR